METIKQNINRVGNFTSSEIVALTSNNKEKKPFGKPGLTYIAECNMERRLGRSLTDEVKARATSWGTLVEARVFELLGLDYKLCSTETIAHPHFPFWKGSPDAEKFDAGKTVCDIKCPLTLKSLCTMVDCLSAANPIEALRENHSDGEKFYWQLVSNAILTGAKFAELIIYCPYKNELEEIRELARNADEGVQSKFYWVHAASDDELPFLIEGGYYKNLNIIRFEVPQADKALLTERVALAGKELQVFQTADAVAA